MFHAVRTGSNPLRSKFCMNDCFEESSKSRRNYLVCSYNQIEENIWRKDFILKIWSEKKIIIIESMPMASRSSQKTKNRNVKIAFVMMLQ